MSVQPLQTLDLGVRRDMVADTAFLALLGDQERSVFERLDDPRIEPGASTPTPFVIVKTLADTFFDTWVSNSGVQIWVYDDRNEQKHRIAGICGYLIWTLFPPRRGHLYPDPVGITLEWGRGQAGQYFVDPNWDLDARWVEFPLRRA